MDSIVKLIDTQMCTGCRMCERICSFSAITMVTAEDGFAYPVVSEKLCKNCGMCVKVCPLYSAVNRE